MAIFNSYVKLPEGNGRSSSIGERPKCSLVAVRKLRADSQSLDLPQALTRMPQPSYSGMATGDVVNKIGTSKRKRKEQNNLVMTILELYTFRYFFLRISKCLVEQQNHDQSSRSVSARICRRWCSDNRTTIPLDGTCLGCHQRPGRQGENDWNLVDEGDIDCGKTNHKPAHWATIWRPLYPPVN